MPGEPVILVCPVCASAVETVSLKEAQMLECLHCGQRWIMVVDVRRVAEYSLT